MNSIETVVHISQSLNADQQGAFIQSIGTLKGVGKVAFAHDKPHLLLLTYDSVATSATKLLSGIRSLGLEGQLVAL